MTQSTTRSVLQNPYHQFTEDLIANPSLAPQLMDPNRTASIKVFHKGTFPDREPDISTPRTDVYILGWEESADEISGELTAD